MITLKKPLQCVVPLAVSALLMLLSPLASANPPEGRMDGPAGHMQSRMHPPVPPLMDVRGIAPQLKLTAEQEKRYLKAESLQGELLQAGQYQMQKQMTATRAALADNKVSLSQLLKQQDQQMQEMQKQAAQASVAWAAFYDSLDATQTALVRQHLLAKLSGMGGQDRWSGDDRGQSPGRHPTPGMKQPQE